MMTAPGAINTSLAIVGQIPLKGRIVIVFSLIPRDTAHCIANLVQATVIVDIVGVETVDEDALVAVALGVNVLGSIEGQRDMYDGRGGEENQVALTHLCARHVLCQR